MNWEAWVTLATVVLILWGLARNVAGADVVLSAGLTLLTTLSLASDRFPTPRQAAAGFGNEGLLTVAVLFVVAAGLTETGGLSLITERLLGRPSTVARAQVRLMVPVAAVSAFLNNTPVVAMFMPVVSDWSKRARISASKLFIPLSYAAVLGGLCTLIGTSTNLVVQALLIEARTRDPQVPVMGMFTLSWVGVPIAIAGIVYVVAASRFLLPDRQPASASFEDPREYTVEMLVQPKSAIDGMTIEDAGLRRLPGCYLAAIERDGERLVAVGPEQVLRGADRLVFAGVIESVVDLQKVRGLIPATNQVDKLPEPRRNRCLVEAVVSPTCPLVGRTVREGRFRTAYDAVVIAVHRNGERLDSKIGDIRLRAGDTLLLETHLRFLESHRDNRDFFLVSRVQGSSPPRHERAWVALVILGGMVAAASLENLTRINIFNAALIAAGLMIVTRCCSAQQARQSVDWATLVAIGASLGVGRAVETSGLGGQVAARMLAFLEPVGPWAVLAGIYLITLVFTEIVTNNAAAALAFPIAYATAQGLGVNFLPFAIAIAVAASAGFATPLGYQTHLMVYGPGGYRFGDYVRLGLPLDLLVMTLAVLLIPLLYPF